MLRVALSSPVVLNPATSDGRGGGGFNFPNLTAPAYDDAVDRIVDDDDDVFE